MKLTFAGGAREIGGSCIFVQMDGHGILLDAGTRQEYGEDRMPDLYAVEEAGNVDVILVSHAHMDHIGALPVISRMYPDAAIYMNQMTRELTRCMLTEYLRHPDFGADPSGAYTQDDVETMLGRVRLIRFLNTTEILPGINATMYPAGHVAGAGCFLLEGQEGRLFYTGDFSGFIQKSVERAWIPQLRPDVVILESTYGSLPHGNRPEEEALLADAVAECVAREEKILIPAFALGRAQEILLILREAINKEKIPRVPVLVEGIVRDVCRIYGENMSFISGAVAKRVLKGKEAFYNDDIHALGDEETPEELLATGPVIVVCSSDPLTGGPDSRFAAKLLADETACLLLTGWNDEEQPDPSLVRNLGESDEQRRVSLDGQQIPVRCRVVRIPISTHADQSEIVDLVDRMSPHHVILVHGEDDAVEALSEVLASDYRRRIYKPEMADCLELVLRGKREQIPQKMLFTLGKPEQIRQDQAEELWNTWTRRYAKRSLTEDQAAYLWFGREMQDRHLTTDEHDLDSETLQIFVNTILDSDYFVRDFHRMFMIRPRTGEEIEDKQKSGEIKAQDVIQRVQELLEWKEIRKIGYYPDLKEVVINVDFPDAVPKDELSEARKTIEAETGWTLSLSTGVNFHAADLLIRQLFGERIRKISYFQENKCFEGTLDGTHTPEDDAARDEFERQTGWKLNFRDEQIMSSASTIQNESEEDIYWFLPEPGIPCIEQNRAMSLVELSFNDETKPYRISIRKDASGPYFDFSYVTPEMGLKSSSQIEAFVFQTGWRVHITRNVNQGQLMSIAETMCIGEGIKVLKTPSYMGDQRAIRVQTDVSLPETLKNAFFERTGFLLIQKQK